MRSWRRARPGGGAAGPRPPVPRRMRLVACAIAASVTHASADGTPQANARWSHTKTGVPAGVLGQDREFDRDARVGAVAERADVDAEPHTHYLIIALRHFHVSPCHDGVMAYDEALADKVRKLMAGEPGRTEKRMFGGLAMLLNGNMAVAIRGRGGLMIRVDPDESDALLDEAGGVDRGHAGAADAGLDRGRVRGRRQGARSEALGQARFGVRAHAAS